MISVIAIVAFLIFIGIGMICILYSIGEFMKYIPFAVLGVLTGAMMANDLYLAAAGFTLLAVLWLFIGFRD